MERAAGAALNSCKVRPPRRATYLPTKITFEQPSSAEALAITLKQKRKLGSTALPKLSVKLTCIRAVAFLMCS